jgi:hypothetical protein
MGDAAAALVPAPRLRAFGVGFDARDSPLTHERGAGDAFRCTWNATATASAALFAGG